MGNTLCCKKLRKIDKGKINFLQKYKFPESVETRLEGLKFNQNKDEIIDFNIGGQIFKISKHLIMQCPYDSFFKDCVIKFADNLVDEKMEFF
jgi:hypothetical protein